MEGKKMTVYELTQDQLEELAARYLDEKNEQNGEGTSWTELAIPFEFVSKEEILEEYADTIFSDDDFSCTAGRE
jgi:hypothetical protein